MKISFDPKHDILYLKFSEERIVDTIEVDGSVLIDYGDKGQMVGIEIINASSLIKANPLHEIVIKIQKETEA
ncbi:MAG TPA: DUF2283 domain-containing protein [Methanotrichaceae archaeon]|nr:DUF2283 domain-containing protein [Methanotrichaceae archaeon]